MKEYKIPGVVAGGIYTREDADKIVALGADGVQMSTRFVTTYECDAHDNYKQAYINARKEEIEIIKSPVGMPGRAIHNHFIEQINKQQQVPKHCYQCIDKCNPSITPYCITQALKIGRAHV